MSNIVKFERLPHDICRVTSAFGYRTNPITGAKSSFHQGIDFGAFKAGVPGDKLFAVADGKVVYAAYMASTVYGYGYFIIIEHDKFCTLYAHMREHILAVNQCVKAGDIVGYMGSTGASTAAHLHFEVEPIKWTGYADYIKQNANGVRMYAVDPYTFVLEYRNRLEVKEVAQVTTVDDALKKLKDKGIMNSTEYWKNASSVVKYLDTLLINVANAVN